MKNENAPAGTVAEPKTCPIEIELSKEALAAIDGVIADLPADTVEKLETIHGADMDRRAFVVKVIIEHHVRRELGIRLS